MQTLLKAPKLKKKQFYWLTPKELLLSKAHTKELLVSKSNSTRSQPVTRLIGSCHDRTFVGCAIQQITWWIQSREALRLYLVAWWDWHPISHFVGGQLRKVPNFTIRKPSVRKPSVWANLQVAESDQVRMLNQARLKSNADLISLLCFSFSSLYFVLLRFTSLWFALVH